MNIAKFLRTAFIELRWPLGDISDVAHFFSKKGDPLFFLTVITSGNVFLTVISGGNVFSTVISCENALRMHMNK